MRGGRAIRVHMAHMPGDCAAAQTPDGHALFTSGVDGTLRLHDISDAPAAWWKSQTPKEPTLPDLSVADFHEKAVTALAISPNGQTLASASEDGFVRIFSLTAPSSSSGPKDLIFVQSCARFGGPVKALAFSPTGAFLAAGGQEPGVVKIIMTAQPSNVNILRASQGPAHDAIAVLQFDPSGDYVVSVGEKGVPVVWDVDKCILKRTVDLNDRKAISLSWAPDGSHIVFATNRGAVVVSRASWVYDFLLEDTADKDDDDDDTSFAPRAGKEHITAVAWSPNGRYILAARKDSSISLWDVTDRKVLAVWKADQAVQKLLWHFKANAFVVVDELAHWGVVSDVVPSHMPKPQEVSGKKIALPSLPETDTKTSKKRAREEPEDDDDEEDITVKRGTKGKKSAKKEKKKRATSKKPPVTDDVVEEANGDELENDFQPVSLSDVDADEEEELRNGRDDEGSNASDEDSDEEVPGELAGLENAGVRLPDAPRSRRAKAAGKLGGAAALVVETQAPFVPSSTPASEKISKKRRILAWNLVGAVLSFAEQTHDVVEVEFAEATRRSIGIKDHFGYSMGCLTETGVFLASGKSKNHGALVTFRPFSSWASNAEWTLYLPPEEDLSVVAMGKRFACAATTPNNVIRVFSLSGLQTSVFGVAGKIITMAASQDQLVTVYCETGSGALKCEVLEVNAEGEPEKVVYNGGLVVCGGAQIEWLGFTNDTKEVCVYDSKGWLWLLVDARGTQRWIPVVQEAAKSAECDWFWAASATSEHLIGAACLSNERFPPAKPRPALRPVALSAPVIERKMKNGKATVTERLGRTKLRLLRAAAAKRAAEEMYGSDDDEVAEADDVVVKMETETDKCVLNLMEDACRREQNMRALDLATRLHSEVSFKFAVELARHFKREALAVRVEQVAMQKLSVLEGARGQGGGRDEGMDRQDGSPVTREMAGRRTPSKAERVVVDSVSDEGEGEGEGEGEDDDEVGETEEGGEKNSAGKASAAGPSKPGPSKPGVSKQRAVAPQKVASVAKKSNATSFRNRFMKKK